MKIFSGDPTQHHVAENVKIGDPLTLVISIDKQEMFGLKISDCLVRDGLGWGEQRLINNEGYEVIALIISDKRKLSLLISSFLFIYVHTIILNLYL